MEPCHGARLCQTEDVPVELLSLLGAQHLEITGQWEIFSVLDGIEEILSVSVWVLGSPLTGVFICEDFAALIRLAVNLYVVENSVRLCKCNLISRSYGCRSKGQHGQRTEAQIVEQTLDEWINSPKI